MKNFIASIRAWFLALVINYVERRDYVVIPTKQHKYLIQTLNDEISDKETESFFLTGELYETRRANLRLSRRLRRYHHKNDHQGKRAIVRDMRWHLGYPESVQ